MTTTTPKINSYTIEDADWCDAVEFALTDSSSFPWQFEPRKITHQEILPWNSQFVHVFYDNDEPQSPFITIIEPLIEFLDPLCLIKAKANLTIATENPQAHEWHQDTGDERIMTALYYANTNNGFTEFETGERVDCERGELITFPSTLKHRAWTHTDTQARAVIHISYIARG